MSSRPPFAAEAAVHDVPVPALVQLVSPAQGGVRDYLEYLRRGWQQGGRPSEVLELSQAAAAQSPLAARLAGLVPAGRCVLVVHFSGYGFHPRGLCAWLVQEIESARRALGPRLRVLTMFHELFASGPPWRSAFWLGSLQAAIAARLARASDSIATNSEHHARWLQQRAAGVPVQVRPVFSTIGEPATVSPLHGRARRLVVFGSASTRARALRRLPPHVRLLREHGIKEVLEVGSGEPHPWRTAGLLHRPMGRLAEAELQRLLKTSAYGLIDYPSVHLGKSTVYAAYAAHGCVVLNTAAPGPDADGLQHGLHYQTLGSAGQRWADEPQALADAACAWYANHTVPLQVLAFERQCDAAWSGGSA